MRFADLRRAPFGRSPIKDLALRDQVAHGADGLLDRRVRIGPMTKVEIKIIHAEAAERGVARFDHMLAAQSFLIRQIAAPEHFA